MKKLFFLFLLIGSFATKTLSAELPAKPPAQENRFLFVVETSLAMKNSAQAAQNTVRELIETGVQGQMHPGDTFGLWTFNEKLNVEFPMQRWTPGNEKKLGQLAGDYLKKQRYEKKAPLRMVLPPLYSVIKSSKAITVILISTGNEPIQGTPFDKEINAVYPSYVRELHDAKLAFVTILVGRNGKPVAYSVNSSLGPIQIPHPPIEPEIIAPPPKTNAVVAPKKVVSTQTTNQASVQKSVELKIAPVAKVTPATDQPITVSATAITKIEIKTNEVGANVSANTATPFTAPKVELATPPVQPTAAVSPAPEKPAPPKGVNESSVTTTIVASTAPSSKTEPTPKIETPSSVSQAAVSDDAPGVVTAETNNVASIDSKQTDQQTSTQKSILAEPISPAPMVATQTVFTSQRLIVVGAALLLVAGFFIFLLVRHSRKSQPSLISHSIDRSK